MVVGIFVVIRQTVSHRGLFGDDWIKKPDDEMDWK